MMGTLSGMYQGMRIYESDMISTVLRQVKFPHCKSKRIRKKFTNNPDNWKEFDQMLMFGDQCFASPEVIRKLNTASSEVKLEFGYGSFF